MKIRKTTKWNNAFASSVIYLDFVFSLGTGLAEGGWSYSFSQPISETISCIPLDLLTRD